MSTRKKDLQLAGGKVPRLRKPDRRRFTAAKQDKFFATLASSCNVLAACRAARVCANTVYKHRNKDARFRARWAEALREAYARLELMMLERMMNGTVTTRTKADGAVETTHQYPNAIALQLLRMHRAAASEAEVEHDEQDVEEVRERLVRRIERLKKRMRDESGDGAGA